MSNVGNEVAWGTIVKGLIFNPSTAVCAYWLQLKEEGMFIGLPVTNEIPDPDTGGVQMAFSSGAVICWNPNEGASLR